MADKKQELIIENKPEEIKLRSIFSRVNYPIVIKYNNEDMVVSPRATVEKINPRLLNETLPEGLQLI